MKYKDKIKINTFLFIANIVWVIALIVYLLKK